MRNISTILLFLVLVPLASAFSCKSGWEVKGEVGSSSIDVCPSKFCMTTTIEDKSKANTVETTKWACAQSNQCKTAGCKKEEKNGVKTKTCCCKGDKCNDGPKKEHVRVARRAPSKTTVSRKNTTPRPWFMSSTPARNPGTKANTVGIRATSPRPVFTYTTKAKPYPIRKATKAQYPVTARPQPWFTASNKVTSRPVRTLTTKSWPYPVGKKIIRRSVDTPNTQPKGTTKPQTKLASASKHALSKSDPVEDAEKALKCATLAEPFAILLCMIIE